MFTIWHKTAVYRIAVQFHVVWYRIKNLQLRAPDGLRSGYGFLTLDLSQLVAELPRF
jgi:hypothetical protein